MNVLIEEILNSINVGGDVREALEHGKGVLGTLLVLSEPLENGNGELCHDLAAELPGADHTLINTCLTQALAWASNIGLQRLDVVVQWNPATKTYDKTYIVGVSPPSLDITLAASSGYWVSTTVNQTIHIYGAAPTAPQTRTITATGSTWVNMGLVALNTTWRASRIPTLISGATVSTVAMYNPVTKSYKTYITGVPPSDFTLVPGQALWVQVSASGTFTYAP